MTTSDASEVDAVEPPAFSPKMVPRTVPATSEQVRVYDEPVAPSIVAQEMPLASQRSQPYSNDGEPDHVPFVAIVSVEPEAADPRC